MLYIALTVAITFLLGLVLFVNDAGLLAIVVWPIVFLLQSYTWFLRGQAHVQKTRASMIHRVWDLEND